MRNFDALLSGVRLMSGADVAAKSTLRVGAAPRAFISYMSEDHDIVVRLANDLRAHDIEVFLDKRDLPGGRPWDPAIKDAIAECDFFIACFSSVFPTRPTSFMRREIAFALQRARKLRHRVFFVPVRLDPSPLPQMRIGLLQSLADIHAPDLSRNWSEGVLNLLETMGLADLDSRRLTSAIDRLRLGEVHERESAAGEILARESLPPSAIDALVGGAPLLPAPLRVDVVAAVASNFESRPELIAFMQASARDANRKVRRAALRMLFVLGDEAIDTLASDVGLVDEEASAHALLKLAPTSARAGNALIARFGQDPDWSRDTALELAKIETPCVLEGCLGPHYCEIALSALEGATAADFDHVEILARLYQRLGEHAHAHLPRLLAAFAAAPKKGDERLMLRALLRVADAPIVPVLLRAANGAQASEREAALLLLGTLAKGSQEAIFLLKEAANRQLSVSIADSTESVDAVTARRSLYSLTGDGAWILPVRFLERERDKAIFMTQIHHHYGMDAREARLTAEQCLGFHGAVRFDFEGETAEGRSMLDLMSLCIRPDLEFTVTVEGKGADLFADKLVAMFAGWTLCS